MSWQEKLLNGIAFTIITGDGKSYTPRMIQSVVELTFNTRDFLYLDADGKFVGRKASQGEEFPLEFWFVGNDNIEVSNAFRESSKNRNPWTIQHPVYDELTVQPDKLKFRTKFSVTIVTGKAKATLPEQLPEANVDLETDINKSIVAVDDAIVNGTEGMSVATAQSSVDVFATNYDLLPATSENVAALADKVRDATNKAVQILEKPVAFNDSVQSLIKFPLTISETINAAIVNARDALNDLVNTAFDDPFLFDLNSTLLLTTVSSMSMEANYSVRSQIQAVQDIIVDMFEIQNATFESLGYEQNDNIVFELSLIIAKTIGRLNEIAFTAKREYNVIADVDLSATRYCHRFYGDVENNIDKFIEENNLTMDEHWEVKQGRELVYYV